MNICFLYGKIISDINFKFLLNKSNISICFFDLKLLNGSITRIVAFDEYADFCFSRLRRNNLIVAQGFLNNKYEVIIDYINKMGDDEN